MRNHRLSALALMVIGLGAAPAFAADGPLKDVSFVSEGLITAGMAIEINDKCDSVSVRLVRGYNFLNSLKTHARNLGYTEAEIDAYINDAAEKARLESVARGRLADLGVVPSDPESYCAVGTAQIAAGTPLGRLLY